MKGHVWSWKGTRPPSGWRSMVDPRIPWSKVDWSLVFLALLLVGTSLAFVHRMAESDWMHGRDDIVFESHLKKYIVAAPFLLLGFFLRPRWLRRNAWLAYRHRRA